MKFSLKVKKELVTKSNALRHCDIAEILGFIYHTGVITHKYGHTIISVKTENRLIAQRLADLLFKTFDMAALIRCQFYLKPKRTVYYIYINNNDQSLRLLGAMGFRIEQNGLPSLDTVALKNECCKRAFLRASFITNGSLSDPSKNYHLEYAFLKEENATLIKNELAFFDLKPRIITRKKHYVVYLKEGENIADLLNIMGAHTCLLDFENIRITKYMGNYINRTVNFETANIKKTVNAAIQYQEDIVYIEKTKGLSYLSKPLMEIAELRLENPNSTLKEIGEMAVPPLSKSGVNHRLRKISEIAEKLRGD